MRRYKGPQAVQTLLLNSILNVRRCAIRGLHWIGNDYPDSVERPKDAHVAIAAILRFELITVHERILGCATLLEPDGTVNDRQHGSELDQKRQSTHEPISQVSGSSKPDGRDHYSACACSAILAQCSIPRLLSA